MSKETSPNWISSLNKINSSVLMPIVVVALFLYNTIVNKWVGGAVETVQNITMILILAIFALNFFAGNRDEKKRLLKDNNIVIVYLLIRVVTFVLYGFNYSILRSIILESFFLLGIQSLKDNRRENFRKYVSIFIVLETVFTFLSLIVFVVFKLSDQTPSLILDYTNQLDYPYGSSALFVNLNSAGIMAGFAAIVFFNYFMKESRKNYKIFYGVMIIYNLAFMGIQRCKSACLAVGAIIIILLVCMKLKNVSKKRITAGILLVCIVAFGGLYGFINYNLATLDPYSLLDPEPYYNKISSNRYMIWKGCVIQHREKPILGAGSLALEDDLRKEITHNPEAGYSGEMKRATTFGPHNGYIGMISVAGFSGLILFLLILFKGIKKSSLIEDNNWYLIIIYALFVNFFECLFIINRFFLSFYVFMLLDNKNDLEDRK